MTIGDSGTGKTSILSRFMSNTFQTNIPSTHGIDWFAKTVSFLVDGEQRETKLYVWDTSGQERYKSLMSSYIKGASVVLLVFDLNNPATLKELPNWLENIHQREAEFRLYLVGNKGDLEKNCDDAEIQRILTETHSIKYFKVSAKTGEGINDMFTLIGKELYTASSLV